MQIIVSVSNNVAGAGTGVKHRNHDWINVMGTPNSPNRHSDSAETQRRMDDIMQQTGVLKLRSKVYIDIYIYISRQILNRQNFQTFVSFRSTKRNRTIYNFCAIWATVRAGTLLK